MEVSPGAPSFRRHDEPLLIDSWTPVFPMLRLLACASEPLDDGLLEGAKTLVSILGEACMLDHPNEDEAIMRIDL